MKQLIGAELQKIQWILVAVLILLDVSVNIGLGVNELTMLEQHYVTDWPHFLMVVFNFHSMFFLPLFSGILAGLLCAYEHKSGGWKQLFAMPYSSLQVYGAKLAVLAGLLALLQAILGAATAATGLVVGLEGSLVLDKLLTGIGAGWLGVLPLAALQLWFSSRWKKFGVAFGVNVVCILPSLVLTGLPSQVGMWIPYLLPFYTMMPQGTPFAPRVEPISLYIWIMISGSLLSVAGGRFFKKKAAL